MTTRSKNEELAGGLFRFRKFKFKSEARALARGYVCVCVCVYGDGAWRVCIAKGGMQMSELSLEQGWDRVGFMRVMSLSFSFFFLFFVFELEPLRGRDPIFSGIINIRNVDFSIKKCNFSHLEMILIGWKNLCYPISKYRSLLCLINTHETILILNLSSFI